MFDVAIFGRTVWDEWRLPGELTPQTTDCFGGPGANVAVHLAQLGLRCTLVTTFGSDSYSARYTDYLLNLGINLDFSIFRAGSLPRCEIWPGKRFIWLSEHNGQDALFDLPIEPAVKASRAAYFADFPLRNLERVSLPADSFCAPQLTLFVDPMEANRIVQRNWRAVFLNRKEANCLSTRLQLDFTSISRTQRTTAWLITNEDQPTVRYLDHQKTHHSVLPVKFMNSAGGGDAFAAGYTAAILAGLGTEDAIDIGHQTAREIVQQTGCQADLSKLRELRHRLNHATHHKVYIV